MWRPEAISPGWLALSSSTHCSSAWKQAVVFPFAKAEEPVLLAGCAEE